MYRTFMGGSLMYIRQSVFHLYGWITLFRLTEYISPLWVDNSYSDQRMFHLYGWTALFVLKYISPLWVDNFFISQNNLVHKGLLLTLDTSI